MISLLSHQDPLTVHTALLCTYRSFALSSIGWYLRQGLIGCGVCEQNILDLSLPRPQRGSMEEEGAG